MVYVKPDAPYLKLLAPFLQKKKVSRIASTSWGVEADDSKDLAIDEWGCDDAPVRDLFDPIYKWMFKAAPWLEKRYPSAWKGVKHINRVLRECLLSVSHDMPLSTRQSLTASGGALCRVRQLLQRQVDGGA
jgi:hypothetical protein